MLGEGDIAQTQYNTCLRETQPFFKESLEYVLTNMDMSESLWSHACWVDFFYRGNSSWSDIEYFVDSFSSILQFDKQEMNLLYENLIFKLCLRKTFRMEHQLLLLSKSYCYYEDEDGKTQNKYRMDILWYHLQSMESPIGNNKRFNILFEVARIVLLIPHSNAAIEGLFSLVNKNHQIEIALTKIRPYLLFQQLSLIVLTKVQLCVMSFSLIKNFWVWQRRQLLIITRNIQINIHIILAFFCIYLQQFFFCNYLLFTISTTYFSGEYIIMFMKIKTFS